jgi:uroporphyrin-III C-methyltransferase/precorrin-2 dehydrogenase/sirohydrochlorin ferrochelatase
MPLYAPTIYNFAVMDYFPLFARLTGATCLVAGGGPVALRKVRQLLRAGARTVVVAPNVVEELQTLADAGTISLHKQAFDADMVNGKLFVIAATDSRQINATVAAAATQANCFCNIVDDRELSTAIIPGVVDRSPLLIAVSTGGESPVLTTRIRQQIESQLPESIARLVQFAGQWRDTVKTAFNNPDDRRRFWQDTLEGPVAQRIMAGDLDGARSYMESSLAGQTPVHGEAWIVGAGPGDPELLTLKAARLIGSADVILYDRLVTRPILEFARKDAEFIPVGKQGGKKSVSQQTINELLVDLVRQGKRVCRLKGGDPFIFGRGGEEIAALEAAGLAWQVVPGITAAGGCAAATGTPLTHRNVAHSVVFATAHTADGDQPDWKSLANSGQTVVFYMALSRLESICAGMLAAGHADDLPAMLIANGTTSQQQSIRGTLTTLPQRATEAALESPALLIIGAVTELAVTRLLTTTDSQAAAES